MDDIGKISPSHPTSQYLDDHVHTPHERECATKKDLRMSAEGARSRLDMAVDQKSTPLEQESDNNDDAPFSVDTDFLSNVNKLQQCYQSLLEARDEVFDQRVIVQYEYERLSNSLAEIRGSQQTLINASKKDSDVESQYDVLTDMTSLYDRASNGGMSFHSLVRQVGQLETSLKESELMLAAKDADFVVSAEVLVQNLMKKTKSQAGTAGPPTVLQGTVQNRLTDVSHCRDRLAELAAEFEELTVERGLRADRGDSCDDIDEDIKSYHAAREAVEADLAQALGDIRALSNPNTNAGMEIGSLTQESLKKESRTSVAAEISRPSADKRPSNNSQPEPTISPLPLEQQDHNLRGNHDPNAAQVVHDQRRDQDQSHHRSPPSNARIRSDSSTQSHTPSHHTMTDLTRQMQNATLGAPRPQVAVRIAAPALVTSYARDGFQLIDQISEDSHVRTLFATQPLDRITDPHFLRRGYRGHMMLFGTNGDNETLYSSFRLRGRKFFAVGRVFQVLWAEPAGATSRKSGVTAVELSDTLRSDPSNLPGRFEHERIYSKVRRFVVIRQAERYCSALPIMTCAYFLYYHFPSMKYHLVMSVLTLVLRFRQPPRCGQGWSYQK